MNWNIRLTDNDDFHGWAENNIVELSDGTIAMLIRADSLGGDTVALLHNPNPNHRSPLALWISFDGLKTWPYRRVLVPESSDGPQGRLNYPDGFVSNDGKFLTFAYDDNRHHCVFYRAKLPQAK